MTRAKSQSSGPTSLTSQVVQPIHQAASMKQAAAAKTQAAQQNSTPTPAPVKQAQAKSPQVEVFIGLKNGSWKAPQAAPAPVPAKAAATPPIQQSAAPKQAQAQTAQQKAQQKKLMQKKFKNSPEAKAKHQLRAQMKASIQPKEDFFSTLLFAEPYSWSSTCKPSSPPHKLKPTDPIYIVPYFTEPANWATIPSTPPKKAPQQKKHQHAQKAKQGHKKAKAQTGFAIYEGQLSALFNEPSTWATISSEPPHKAAPGTKKPSHQHQQYYHYQTHQPHQAQTQKQQMKSPVKANLSDAWVAAPIPQERAPMQPASAGTRARKMNSR